MMTTGASSFSATRVQPPLVVGSQGAPQNVAGVLVPGGSGQDALTPGLFQAVDCCCFLVGDPVYRKCIAGWPVVEGRWIFVTATGTLTDASNAQLESCDDITGDTPLS